MNPHDDDAAPARPMESIKVENLLINFTTEFHRIWDNKGSRSKPGGFWRPHPAPDLLPGFFPSVTSLYPATTTSTTEEWWPWFAKASRPVQAPTRARH